MDISSRNGAVHEDTDESKQVEEKNSERSRELIAIFEDGYALGWRFAVREAFRDALDIKLTEEAVPVFDAEGNHVMVPMFYKTGEKTGEPIMLKSGKPRLKKKTRPERVWTQGKEFNFKSGSVLYDTKLAYELKWGEALKHIKLFVQIVDALPFAMLKFKLYRPTKDFSTIEELETIECTQENFVEFLRTGTVTTKANITRNLVDEYGG